ncbi:MAG TPA: GNAT family N-acetyltransferase [Anaeromyxobacter sp.]|nr:GNAT family N-acetyltransferase [Anaeromyxobacter sp.]
MWRPARIEEDPQIVRMCLELNREDPGEEPVPADHIRATLATFRGEPVRGRAVVLEEEGRLEGYALLASFWSNELGGEVCNVDEIYVAPSVRRRGHAAALLEAVEAGPPLWPRSPVAVELEVSPSNAGARSLYAGLGFTPIRNQMLRRRR